MTTVPSSDARLLDELAADLTQPLSVTQRAGFVTYVDLLTRWNTTYNLTAVRDRDAIWAHHIADCLAVLPALDRHTSHSPTRRLLDVGSGGGLPGVVLALMRPALDVSCVDTVAKKAAFVRQVAGALNLHNLHALHSRVEALGAPPYELITSRAFASLADFTRLTRGLLAPQGVWMAMKGKHPADEMAALPATVAVFHVEPIRVTGLDVERCLVWMKPQNP